MTEKVQSRETSAVPSLWWWVMLCLVALGTRLPGAFFFPNAEQDGYCDAETIARFTAAIADGTFRTADLYGFWLPLFQLVAAILNLLIHNALLAGKILSAFAGAVSCLLAAAITVKLTRSKPIALIAFALVLLSPIHFIYSSACMTDVPFGCLLLACLWSVMDEHWTSASILAALAGAVRVEGWVLIPLLPLLQFVRERRVRWVVFIPLLTPLFWLVITFMARGQWFAFFDDRVVYQDHYIEFHPSRRGFTWADIWIDTDDLLFGANRIAFFAAPVAACLLLFDKIRGRAETWKILAACGFFAAIFGFLVLGYITKRQPVWLPRYGLFALVIGAPLLGWIVQVVSQSTRLPRKANVTIAVFLACLGLFEVRRQYSIVPKILRDFTAHSRVASALTADNSASAIRCFSDDVAVRVLSGLSDKQFVRSTDAPRAAWNDRGAFEAFQREAQINYMTLMPTEDSLPAKWYWSPERRPKMPERFELVTSVGSDFGPAVYLYRVRK